MTVRIPCQTYIITNGDATPETYSDDSAKILGLISKAVDHGLSMVQLREKRLTARQIFELTLKTANITRGSDTKLLVNDRADIAHAAGADGVHLTSTSLPAAVVRNNFPPEFIIGVSAHSLKKAQIAKSDGANFITFSPIFSTKSKIKYGVPQGVEKLGAVVEALGEFPVFALGGIDRQNYREILPTGIAGIAGIGMFYEMLEGDDKL